MKAIYYLLTALLIAVLAMIALFIMDQPELVTGRGHATFKTMLASGGDVSQLAPAKYAAYLLSFAFLAIMCAFIYIGAHKAERIGGIKYYLVAGFLIYALSFAYLIVSHQDYIATGHSHFWGGYPYPTAVMIYLVWSTPMLIVGLYIFGFRQYILSEEDEVEFQRILKRRQERETHG